MPRPSLTWAMSACLALPFVPVTAARADALCAREEVVQVARQEIRKRSHYAEFDASSILEWSTGDPNTVRCTAFALVRAPYAPARNGNVAYRERYRFSVQVTGHRFTVTFAD